MARLSLRFRKLARVLLPLGIGLVGFAVALAVARWGGPLVVMAQVSVTDALMVQVGGPRLGARPIDDRIALVHLDMEAAKDFGHVRSYENDVRLYRNLIEAGALVVFDCRTIAAAEPDVFAEIEPLLEEMLSINDDGRLMRDVWLSGDLQTETEGRYRNLMTQLVVNSHPHALPTVESRLYPLAHYLADGISESAPLVILRRVLGQGKATADEIGEQLRRSGIMTAWHGQWPEQVPAADEPKSTYNIGEQGIHWHPFRITTSLVPPAAFWVSYDPPAAEYPRHSYLDVLNDPAQADFQGKIVFIGYDAEIDPTGDTYAIPSLPSKASCAELVACATQTLLDDRNMVEMPASWIVTLMGTMIVGLALVAGLVKPLLAAAVAASLLLLYFAYTVWAYRSGWYPDCLLTPGFATATAVTAGIGNAWLDHRLRRRVMDLFGRYVPRAVVNQLMQRPELEALTVGGTVRNVTVMFADIRGFTTYSQHLPPDDVVRELNALLEVMVACTFENEGTLDKFIGDAILVLFNAPLDQSDHAERAVRTAVAIQQRLAGHGSGLRVGIGVHRGEAVVGNIGTPQRMEYTAIGSTVNIASRLCDYAQPGEVVVSQQVFDSLGPHFNTEPLGAIEVKGISQPIEVARVSALRE